jgi:hypothetical protein
MAGSSWRPCQRFAWDAACPARRIFWAGGRSRSVPFWAQPVVSTLPPRGADRSISVLILRSPSILLCRRLVLLCCAALVVSLLASAEAESAVTRAEVRWSWSSNPSGGPPLLRALTPTGGVTAGCWPVGAVVLGPCPDPAQAGWEGRDLDPQGNPRMIAYVDRSSDQRREYEFEVYIPCVPPCGELTVWGTIRNADGSTKRVPPFTLDGGRRFGISAGRAPEQGRKRRAPGRRNQGAFYGAKTVVTGGTGPGSNSADPTVSIRVARNRRTLDVLGPHDRCSHGAGGFNAVEYFYPKVDDVRIKPDGSFRGSTSYVQEFDGAYYHYEFTFKVRIKGRFVSPDTAKGSLSWQMTVGGTRQVTGEPSPCPPLRTTFTAKRLRAGKMPGRTKWHPEGQVPP